MSVGAPVGLGSIGLLLLIPATACSGSDAGTGSSTLRVSASVHAYPMFANAREPADFQTVMTVGIARDTAAAFPPTITITSEAGVTALERDKASSDTVFWKAFVTGYEQTYELDIEAGDDRVNDVRVDGPDIHHVTGPMTGASLRVLQPIDVTWDSAEEAAAASIWLLEQDLRSVGGAILPADSGAYTLPADTLMPDDVGRISFVAVVRENSIRPRGALESSKMQVAVTNMVEVTVVP